MAQKKILCCVVLLIFILNIVPTSGLSNTSIGTIAQSSNNNDDVIRSNNPKAEIRPIEEMDTGNYKNSYFQPSPISENNNTAALKSVKTQSDRIVVNIDLEKSVIPAGQPLNYIIQVTIGGEPAQTNLVVDIIKGEYWGWYIYYDSDYYWNYNNRVIESHEITTDSEGVWASSFVNEENGRYSIVVRSQEEDLNVLETRSFTVADIGIFWRLPYDYVVGEPYYSIAYVLNTSDFSPIQGAEITLNSTIYRYSEIHQKYVSTTQEVYSGVTDGNGSIELEFLMKEEYGDQYSLMLNLSANYNGETTYVSRDIFRGGVYWGWNSYSSFEPYEFVITTDKPIYLPGESINARILVWKNDYYKVSKRPIETEIKVELLSPSNYVFANKIVQSNEYGISTMTFQLDDETELGNYQIVVTKDGSSGSLGIRVDKYEKPSFRVNLNLEQDYIPPGKVLEGNVTAEYYFGKPVADAKVTLIIGDFKTITGKTNTEGYWKFKYRIPGIDQLENVYSIPVNVSVEDTVGRIVEASSSVSVYENIYVWGYVNPWNPRVDENITVYFGAYQYQGSAYWWGAFSPIKNAKVKLTLFGIISEKRNISTITIESITDENGRGQAHFMIPLAAAKQYTRFAILTKVTDNSGREGSTLVYFTVRRNIVETSLDSESYNRGDNVKVAIKVKNSLTDETLKGGVKIRVYDADYDLIVERIESVPDEGATFTFSLSDYAPKGVYRIHVYINTTYDYIWGSWTYYQYFETVDFRVGTMNDIQLSTDSNKYSLGDTIKVSGQLTGETNVPVIIQLVKKGIVRNIMIPIDPSGKFEIEIEEIGALAPKVTVVAFAILSNGLVLEDYLPLEIDPTIIVEIESDKPVYEPGEESKITIRTYDSQGSPLSTVLAVSFVDSSVYGVQPDTEPEKEFFEEVNYWPSIWTVVSWKNTQRMWFFLWYEDFNAIGLVPRTGYEEGYSFYTPDVGVQKNVGMDREQTNSGVTNEKIRDNLPENAFWKPLVFLKDGKWEGTIVLPDNIGEWTVRVVATTATGQGSLEKYHFKTFLPFFVEIQKEPFVIQDDIFVIKGIVYNYLDEIAKVSVEIQTTEGIYVLGRTRQEIKLPQDFLGSITWTCLAEQSGFQNITISATTVLSDGVSLYDALRKPMEIIPNGITKTRTQNGFISQNPVFSYQKYEETISSKEFIQLTLGFGPIAISSWERLIGYPYGCTEQTMSKLIPDALILQYLREKGLLTSDIEIELDSMIQSGLSRVYSQNHKDGGWGWWSDDPSRVYLTSLVLYGLGVVNDTGYYIDPVIVEGALDYLKSRQNFDGSWYVDSWRGIDQGAFTAYVLRSILQWENASDVGYTIQQGVNYIKNTWETTSSRSTYLAGLYLSSVPKTNYNDVTLQDSMYSYLLDQVKVAEKGYYWNYATEEHYWWRALGGDIEVTSLAMQGLAVVNEAGSYPTIRGAIEWLLSQQNSYGWGNTADTAAAISGILYLSSSNFSNNNDTTVILKVNGKNVSTFNLTMKNDTGHYLRLDEYLITGNNSIELTKIGEGNVIYYFEGVQVLRKLPTIQIPKEMTVTTESEFSLPITLSPESTNVFAYNVVVTPLKGNVNPVSFETKSIGLLSTTETLEIEYIAPSKTGDYEISGFEIGFNLTDTEGNSFSPVKIIRRYGPITVHVIEETGLGSIDGMISDTGIEDQNNIINYAIKSSNEYAITRSYSKKYDLVKGDLISVKLTITNNKGKENFLMLEDFVPAGFEVEPNTIKQTHGSYRLTSSGITFFFPELTLGTVTVEYGIVVNNVKQSLVRPAKLSNMYDSWEVLSSADTLGDMRVSIDVNTGKITRDTELPVIEKFDIEEAIQDNKAITKITVEASDNWGVASVKIYIRQEDNWKSFECSQNDENWLTTIFSLKEGNTEIYIEVVDEVGNVFVSDNSFYYLELQDLYIPLVQVIALFTVSLAVALFATLFVRKKVS